MEFEDFYKGILSNITLRELNGDRECDLRSHVEMYYRRFGVEKMPDEQAKLEIVKYQAGVGFGIIQGKERERRRYHK